MLAVSSALPTEPTSLPPVILVHGAANSAQVWTFWQQQLANQGWASHAIDLRGHGGSRGIDLSGTSMQDYIADIRSLINQLKQRPVVMGWSMGGLLAMMVAATGDAIACVALAPSMPARRTDGSIPLRTGEFGPEEYGITSRNPQDQPRMADLDQEERTIALASLGRESRLARDERKAGIVIESLLCPLLIVTGTEDREWPMERYHDLWLNADYYQVEGASHWGLMLNRRALAKSLPVILHWLTGIALSPAPPLHSQVFEGYMTEREREFKLRSLSEIMERYKATRTLPPEEGRKVLALAAALREHASPYKQMLLEIVERVLGLPLNSQKPEKYTFLKGKAEHHTFGLIRGLTLSLAWDGTLLAITLDPQQWRLRAQALSTVGIGHDQASDVAERHDDYLADAIQHG